MAKKTEMVKFRLDDQTLAALRAIAKYRGTDMSDVIRAQIKRSAQVQGLWK